MRVIPCLAIASVIAGCVAPARWEIAFERPLDEASAVVVETQILAGGCASGTVVFEETLTRTSSANMPRHLPAGRVGFAARARDASCRVIAMGCAEHAVPLASGTTITTVLGPGDASECASGLACVGGHCDPADASVHDAGRRDAEVSDVWMPDGGGPMSVRSLSVGDYTSCAVISTGQVECWGSDAFGVLGDGPGTAASSQPVLVAGISDAVSVVVGYASACAIRTEASGAVSCWGIGGGGRLGNDSLVSQDAPVAVVGADRFPIGGVVQLAIYDSFVLARRSDGALWYWGTWGSLLTEARFAQPVFAEIVDATWVHQNHGVACVIDGTSAVRCAGGGWVGRPTADAGPSADAGLLEPLPTSPPLLAAAIGGTEHDTCVVTLDGGVACWGANYAGSIDHAAPVPVPSPREIAGLDSIRTVGASDMTICALDAVGDVRCWGSNARAQLGVALDADLPPTATPVALPGPATQLAVGPRHVCAVVSVLMPDDSVYCWGIDHCGTVLGGTGAGGATCIDQRISTPHPITLRRP